MISPEFRRTIKPLILTNSILATGLLEYYDDNTSNTIGLIYAFFSIFIYAWITYILVFVMNVYVNKGEFMLQVTYKLHTFSHTFFQVYTIVAGFFRRKKIKYVLMQMESCVREMHELGISKNYSKTFKFLCYIFIGTFTVILFMCIIDIVWVLNSRPNVGIFTLMSFMEHYPFFVLSTTEATFIFWTVFIKMKFGELNAVLRGMLTTTIDSPQHKRVLQMKDNSKDDSPSTEIYRTYKTNADTTKIKRIKQIHLEWIKCARMVNATYGWFVLMSMTMSFILLTTLFYNVYNLTFEKFLNKKLDLAGFIYWILYFSLKIIAMSHTCTMTVAEIRDFTQQIIQNPLTFSICGFFNLDHTFIRSVIGSVTTYLVILIQVGNAPLKFFTENGTKASIHFDDM